MDVWTLIVVAAAAAMYLWLVLVVDAMRREVRSLNDGLRAIYGELERHHRELLEVARGEQQLGGAETATPRTQTAADR